MYCNPYFNIAYRECELGTRNPAASQDPLREEDGGKAYQVRIVYSYIAYYLQFEMVNNALYIYILYK